MACCRDLAGGAASSGSAAPPVLGFVLGLMLGLMAIYRLAGMRAATMTPQPRTAR